LSTLPHRIFIFTRSGLKRPEWLRHFSHINFLARVEKRHLRQFQERETWTGPAEKSYVRKVAVSASKQLQYREIYPENREKNSEKRHLHSF